MIRVTGAQRQVSLQRAAYSIENFVKYVFFRIFNTLVMRLGEYLLVQNSDSPRDFFAMVDTLQQILNSNLTVNT